MKKFCFVMALSIALTMTACDPDHVGSPTTAPTTTTENVTTAPATQPTTEPTVPETTVDTSSLPLLATAVITLTTEVERTEGNIQFE